ncbi:MAG TPA: type II toxin-antitoxin system VapC family toxin [Pyrinomonadaceae bacterium]
MSRKPKAIVLDSWAVLAYLEDEPPGERVANLISDAHDDEVPLFMSVLNVGEVWYILARETSPLDADRGVTQLRQLGIRFIDADWLLAYEAAKYKSKHRMSYADCFAAALTKQKNAVLLTGDPEFKQVEREIAISWLTLRKT